MRRRISLIMAMVYVVLEVLGAGCIHNPIKIKAAEGLLNVYWNPMDSSITEVDGTVVSAKGEDRNSGRTKEVPVRTWERARDLVADGGTVYIMSPCISEELPEKQGMRELNGGDKHITIKSIYSTGKQEILDVKFGDTLYLKNITLSPFLEESSVVLLEDTARLVIGAGVSVLNKGDFYVEGAVSDRMELQVDTGEQNWYVTYEQKNLQEGDVLARVPEEFSDAGEHFKVNFSDTPVMTWILEQREKGILGFYEKVVYTDAIYVCDDGADTNSGHSQEKPVKTMKRAISLVQKELNGSGTICICGTYTIAGEEVWDYGENIVFMLTGSGEHDLIVEETGSLFIKSGNVKRQTAKSTAAVLSNGKLELGTGVDTENLSVKIEKGTFAANGGTYTGITNEGGTVTLDGVTVSFVENARGNMEINGGSFSNGNKAVVDNKGTMKVNGGTFTGNRQVIANSGILTWNGGVIQTAGNEYGLVSQGGTLKLEKGSILGTNSVAFNAGTMELNGSKMEILGNIKISKAITMTGNTIDKNYNIVLTDSSFTSESAVVVNVQDNGAFGKFAIASDTYLSSYDATKKEILLYPLDSYYVDTENGEDTKNGNVPEESWKSLTHALSAIPQDKDVVIYLMGSIESQENMTLEYTGSKTVTLKSYKNMTTAFFVQETGGTTLTLKNLILDGSNPVFGETVMQREESVCILRAGTMVLEDTKIQGSIINADGGAVLAEGGTLSLKGTTELSGNEGTNGGAIAQTGGSVSLEGEVKLEGNTATGAGGAVYSVGGSITLSGSVSLKGNSAGEAGGGIYFTGENVIMKEAVSMEENSAGGAGGGIFVTGDNCSILGSVRFEKNSAKGDGGAVYFEGNTLTMESGVTVSGNSGGNGGGMYLAAGAATAVTIGGSFNENKGTNGGGLYAEEGNVSVAGTLSMDGNEATQAGGGIFLKAGSFVGSVNIQNNTGKEKGAAVYVEENSTFCLNGGTIRANGRDAISVEPDMQKKTSNDIYIAGTLEISGTTALEDVIYLTGTANPLYIRVGNASQSCIIGYHPKFEGAVLVEYDSEAAAAMGIGNLKEKDYQEETDEDARPNLSVNGKTVQVAFAHVYLKSKWTDAEKTQAQSDGKIIASTFTEACEKLRIQGKGNLIICGQVLIDSEEIWNFSAHGINWNPEIRFSEECLNTCNKTCTVTCNRTCVPSLHSIYVKDTGKLVLDSVILNGNGAEVTVDGLVYVAGGELCIQGDTIITNSGKRAIYIKTGVCNITNGEIRECIGGGIYNLGTLNITPGDGEKVSIVQNELTIASQGGGAGIYSSGTCNLITEGAGEIELNGNHLYSFDIGNVGGGAIFNGSAGELHIETSNEKGKINFVANIYSVTNGRYVVGGGAICNNNNLVIEGREYLGEKSIVFKSNQVVGGAVNDSGGGAIKNNLGTTKVKHVKFEKNLADGTSGIYGGAMEIHKAKVEIQECIFLYNEARTVNKSGYYGTGGAFSCRYAGCVLLKGGYFKGNHSDNSGGAVYYDKSNYEKKIENCVFEDNTTVSGSGGAISIGSGDTLDYWAVVENCEFRNNAALVGAGGAINGTLKEVKNSVFENNVAQRDGGAISGTVNEVKDSKFINNIANSCGGAYIISNVLMENVEFSGNVSTSIEKDGGGCRVSKNATLDGCAFENNTSARHGGGFICDGIATVKNSEFISNQAKTNGGGAYFATVTMENTEFTGNIAHGLGGGASVTKTANIKDCSFYNNMVDTTPTGNGGGAVYLTGEEAQIANCRMKNNTSTRRGGAILSSSKNCVVVDCSITENFAPMGAVYNSGIIEMQNCDISKNTSDAGFDYAGGIQNGSSGTCTIKNCSVNYNVVESTNAGTGGAAGIDNQGIFYMEDSQVSGNVLNGNVKFPCAILNRKTFTMADSTCKDNDGNGLYVSAGTAYVQGNSKFNGNKEAGMRLEGGNLHMNSGVIEDNKTYGIYMQAGVTTLDGGIIQSNREKDVYVNTGQLKLNAGNVEVAGNIYLQNKSYVVNVHDARSSADNQYNIELSPNFVRGDDVVKPADHIKDTGLYQHFFKLNHTGMGLEPSDGKLLLSQVYFIGKTGKEVDVNDTPGATPKNPFKTWKELKDAIGNKPATIYVCGTIEISGDVSASSGNTWSLATKQNIYRYTGGAIAGNDYSEYAFLNEPLFLVKEGGKAKFENISIYGNKFLEQEVSSEIGSSLIAVEQGGELTLGKNSIIGNTAESGHTGYDSAVIHNGGTLTLTYNAKIQGALALNEYIDSSGKKQMSYVKADDTFTESLTLKLESWKEGQLCVDYGNSEISAEQAAKVTAQYEVDGQICSLVLNMIDSESKRIEVAKKGIFYVDGTRSSSQWETEDGTTPQTAFHSMEQVYNTINETVTGSQSIQYVVYIVGMVQLDGSVGYYSNQAYGNNEDNLAVMVENTIMVKRYSRPTAYPNWKASYEGTLFRVTGGNVQLHNLIVDGHSMPETSTEEGELIVEQEAVETADPLFVTDAGSRLSLTGVTTLRNNGGDMIRAAGDLRLAGNAKISGKVALTGERNRILAEQNYMPSDVLAVSMKNGEEDRILVHYEDTEAPAQNLQTARLGQYILDGEVTAEYRLITSETSGSEIVLKKKGAIYVDPVYGDDANVANCETPQTAVKTLQKAYEAAKNRIGNCNVFVVNPVEITANTIMSSTTYQSGSANVILTKSSVTFYRYVADGINGESAGNNGNNSGMENTGETTGNDSTGDTGSADREIGSLSDSMFIVGNNRDRVSLTIGNIVIDGNKSGTDKTEPEAERKAMISVLENATLIMGTGAFLQNNRSCYIFETSGDVEEGNAPALENLEENQALFWEPETTGETLENHKITEEQYSGGAIHNLGSVEIKGGTITGNEMILTQPGSSGAAVTYPSSMMQGGTLKLEGEAVLSGQEIFLGEGKKIHVSDRLQKTSSLVLRMEDYGNEREVAVFGGNACETGENGQLTVKQEVFAKFMLPTELSKEVVLIRSDISPHVAVLKRLVAVAKGPEDILGPLTEEVRTTQVRFSENTNMGQMHTELWYRNADGRKKVVFAESANAGEKYIRGCTVIRDMQRAEFKIGIPVRMDTVGTYEFSIYLGENLVAKESFVVSAYVWTDGVGNPADKVTLETQMETGELQETTTQLIVYSGYEREMKGWIDSASMEGIDGYEPVFVPEREMSGVPVTEANETFAIRMEEKDSKNEVLTIPAFRSGVMDITFLSHWALNAEKSAMAYLEGICLGEIKGNAKVREHNTSLFVETKTQQAVVSIRVDGETVTDAAIFFRRENVGTLEFSGILGEEGTVPAGTYTLVFKFRGGTAEKTVTINRGQENRINLEFYTVTFEKGAEKALQKQEINFVMVEPDGMLSLPDSNQNLFTWSGYRVSGWKEQGKEDVTLLPGSEVTITGPTVFQAVWKLVPVPVITPTPVPTPMVPEVTKGPQITPGGAQETGKPLQTPGISVETAKPLQTPGISVETAKPLQTPGIGMETEKPLQTPGMSMETLKPLQTPGISMETAKPLQTPDTGMETPKPEKTPTGGSSGMETQKPTILPTVTKTPETTPMVEKTPKPAGKPKPVVPIRTPEVTKEPLQATKSPAEHLTTQEEQIQPEITKKPQDTSKPEQENNQTKPEDDAPAKPPESSKDPAKPQTPDEETWGVEENSSVIRILFWDWLVLLALVVAAKQFYKKKFRNNI